MKSFPRSYVLNPMGSTLYLRTFASFVFAASIICSYAATKPLQTSGSAAGTDQASGFISQGTIATVGDETISSDQYYHRMEYLSGVGTLEGTKLVEIPPGLIALDRMITEKLILILAKKHNVYPTDAQVQQAHRDALQKNPQLDQSYVATGRTLDDLMYQYKVQEARYNLLTEGIIITDQQVTDEYNAHPDSYTVPKLIQLKVIVVADDAAKAEVDKALAAGDDFGATAKKYSIDISKVRDGDFGTVPESALPDTFKTALDGVKIGQASDWFHGTGDQSDLWVKLYFVNATPAKLLPLDDSLTEQIRKQLMEVKGNSVHPIAQELDDLRDQEDIKINNPVFAKAYQTLIDQEKKQHQESQKGS